MFSAIEPDPSTSTVHKAFEQAQRFGPQVLLAIGGGSTMDAAKAVGILLTNGARIHDYEGIDRFNIPPLPLIAIPTTAGTGSEVSGSCVITDEQQNRKMSIRHARLNPAQHAILDPQALVTLPAHVAAHAGLDAFVHALESYTSRQANLLTDALNKQALALISHNLRAFVADRSNTQAGLNMLMGSALTGMAFGQTGLGNVHCMARFIGARLHLSHGLSNALCLPVVSGFNQSAATSKYAEVARIMHAATSGDPDHVAAESAVKAIAALCHDVGIPKALRDVGAEPDTFAHMADDCAQAGYNRWNPRYTSKEDFLDLFERAY
jgi:alcohol dehydrogenase